MIGEIIFIYALLIPTESPEEWYRFDSDAASRGPGGRPGPSPFKSDGNVFSIVPGCTPERIKPDLVHSFHIGFGADLAASIIVWLARLDKFGRLAFDERLRVAYSMFQEYCHEQKRYNSCDEWCLKKWEWHRIFGDKYVFFCFSPCFLFV